MWGLLHSAPQFLVHPELPDPYCHLLGGSSAPWNWAVGSAPMGGHCSKGWPQVAQFLWSPQVLLELSSLPLLLE